MKGADEIKKALKQSVESKKPHARAMLLLVHAAMEGNRNLVLRLFGEPTSGADNCRDYIDDTFPDVQKAVLNGKVSTVVPIEIARRYGHAAVREELLLKTDVNEQEKSVHWHGLRLLVLDINWLRKIHWVQKLRLARNGFKSLPNEMGTYLKQVGSECEALLHTLVTAPYSKLYTFVFMFHFQSFRHDVFMRGLLYQRTPHHFVLLLYVHSHLCVHR